MIGCSLLRERKLYSRSTEPEQRVRRAKQRLGTGRLAIGGPQLALRAP